MMSFNEYFENNQSQEQNPGGAVGQNILPFSLNQPSHHNGSMTQNQSVEFDPELNNQISNAADDMKKLDVLLKHLLETKKISKKQLL